MATSGIGLAFKWTQLTAHFAKQILHTSEVALGRRKATFRLFFAAAIFQDAGRFFDDCTTFFRTSVEYRIDLALRNNDVLLTTNTTVGKQILNVEKTTRNAVERVFAIA